MNDYCRQCVYHTGAGRTDPKPWLKRYNDWCTRWSGVASRKVSHCKLHKGRTLRASVNETGERNG